MAYRVWARMQSEGCRVYSVGLRVSGVYRVWARMQKAMARRTSTV